MSTQFYFGNDFLPYEKLLMGHSRVFTAQKGQTIPILINGEHQSIYILEGQVLSKFTYYDGREKWNYFFEHGSLFPLFTEDTPYPKEEIHTFTAMKRTRFLRIPTQILRQLMKEHPDFAWTALSAAQKIITNLLISSLSYLNHTTKEKVSFLLAVISHDRLEPIPDIRLTQDQIAKFIGCTQSQVAQSVQELRKEQIIQTSPGVIEILDNEKLWIASNLSRYDHSAFEK